MNLKDDIASYLDIIVIAYNVAVCWKIIVAVTPFMVFLNEGLLF